MLNLRETMNKILKNIKKVPSNHKNNDTKSHEKPKITQFIPKKRCQTLEIYHK